jgi:hypothetical protein
LHLITFDQHTFFVTMEEGYPQTDQASKPRRLRQKDLEE